MIIVDDRNDPITVIIFRGFLETFMAIDSLDEIVQKAAMRLEVYERGYTNHQDTIIIKIPKLVWDDQEFQKDYVFWFLKYSTEGKR